MNEPQNDSSDDDFQPLILGRKRRSRGNIPKIDSQKKFKGKGKAIEPELDISSNVGIPDIMENVVSNNLINYSSDNFDESPPALTSRSHSGFKYRSEFIVAESSSAARIYWQQTKLLL